MYRRVIVLMLFTGLLLSVYAERAEMPESNTMTLLADVQDKAATMDIIVNSNTKIQMVGISNAEYLDVFSILGVRVAHISLKNMQGACYIDLPKGLYIFKAGRVAQKVIVR